MRLKEKVALVTGAGSGIGRAAAVRFAAEGARVVVADLKRKTADETVAVIASNGGTAAACEADVSLATSVERMVAFAESEYGRLDILFNNAGIFDSGDNSVLDTEEAVWDRVIDVDLKSVFLGCRYGIPALLRAGGGSIINTASFVALMGASVPQIAYTAAKGGVLSMTREIAVEFARQGIRANALCPGPVETPLLQRLLSDPARRERRLVHIPMGRFGKAEEMAEAALFLASDESSFVTGSTFVVDGGITAAYITPE